MSSRAAALLWLWPLACGTGAGVGEAGSTGTESGATTGTSSSGSSSESVGDTEAIDDGLPPCGDDILAPGDHAFELEHDGLTRTYEVHAPPQHDGSAMLPLLFNLHPWTQDGAYQAQASRMKDKADAEGFVVVHPDGIGDSWNGGPVCCSPANEQNVDDVGFVRAMLEAVAQAGCIDRARVYATGYSNGGYLSYRLACEASDAIAAIGPVSAALGIPAADCQPARPVPAIAIHGTDDSLIAYDFAVAGSDVLADRNGCSAETERTFEQGAAYCDSRTSCAAGGAHTFCTIDGGGHCWFGQSFCVFGQNSDDLDATDAVWAFLSQHALP